VKDRAGNDYITVADGSGHPLILSPARQAKKDRALSGRQEVKWRKEQRRPTIIGFDGARFADFTPVPVSPEEPHA